MSKPSKNDMEDVVEIITETFITNPGVNLVIGEGGNRQKKIRRLAEFVYIKAKNRDGVYISENRMGCALHFKSTARVFSLKEIYYQIRLALSIPLIKIFKTLRREAYLKKIRCQKEYFYVWFLGVKKGGEKAGFELKDQLFQKAKEENLSILVETAVRRNVAIYRRYGFEIYHTWDDKKNNVTLWLMKWDPK